AEAEAAVAVGESALTRFANSFIHQNVGNAHQDVGLRVAVDGRVASGSVDRADEDGLRALVESTLEVAGVMPVDDGWPGLAVPAAAPDVEHWDDATAEVTPDERAAIVAAFVAAGPDYDVAGYCETSAGTTAFANSAGQRLSGRSTRATVDGIHRSTESAGSAHQTSARIGELDGAAAGVQAADRATRGLGAFDITPGEYEVVLAPEAVATMTIFLAYYGFNAKQVIEEQSFVELGVQQFDEALSISDDPLVGADALGVPFDVEGTPSARIDLVVGGVTAGISHDRRTAARMGTDSTGHAYPGSALWGPVGESMIVAAGSD
ncbi:MAG: TldD/PmbA family protein, partial [Actinobacteria bacterium]|nr:TldD/PmbA family protein [Actinomycetota bacterium]NIS29144.1 TldD/PmbA family protein [Actinomycetota bacterium]NIT94373.1 TldD/PmbA family protein [Actinomycetota bacterium]NIU18478.1 TldD/PmbA family protein [Actinomycetota bacterium]NIU64544.1 TldD/PmbA family protein [Actinomycetota bacterium]